MVGMCVGWFLFEYTKGNRKIRMSRVSRFLCLNYIPRDFFVKNRFFFYFHFFFQSTVIIGWFSSSFCLLWLIYGLYNVKLSAFSAAAYSSLSHSAWAMSLAWIVIACSSGYGGYVNEVLSAPIIYPFSRVTYCAYLVHPIAIRFVSLNSDATLHLGSDSMVTFWIFKHNMELVFISFLVLIFRLCYSLATWFCRFCWHSLFHCHSKRRL